MKRYAFLEELQHSVIYKYVDEYLNDMLFTGLSEHTHRRHQSALRSFAMWCEHSDIHDLHLIDKMSLMAYRRYLFNYRKTNGEVLSKGSLNSKLTPVKKFVEWCARDHLIEDNFAHDMEIPRKPKGLPTQILMHEAIEHILQQPNTETNEGLRDRAMMEVLYSTAIRRSEVTGLQCQDIDTTRRVVRVLGAKTGQTRYVPISERALGWVMNYLETVRPALAGSRNDGTLFLSRDGIAFQPGTLAARVKRYIVKAGIKTRGACHLFRHSTATQMLENGADIRYIQALLGHINLNTTEIYTRVSIKKLLEVHARTHPTTRC